MSSVPLPLRVRAETGPKAFITFGAGGGLHSSSLLAVGAPWTGQAGVSPRQWAEGARLTGLLAVSPWGTAETRGTSVAMGSIRR